MVTIFNNHQNDFYKIIIAVNIKTQNYLLKSPVLKFNFNHPNKIVRFIVEIADKIVNLQTEKK